MDAPSPLLPESSTRLPSSPSSPPPPPPRPAPPMAALSDDFTADELEVAGVLLRLPELIRVPFHLLPWGGHGRRSAGDHARRLPQPFAAGDEKFVGAGEGWYSPDTPLQFPASEDDDEGPPRKKPHTIFKKTYKEMRQMFEELNRERHQMLMEMSKLRENYRESHQLNLELKARMIQQDRLQCKNANPSLDLNKATTVPLPSPSPAEPSPPETNHGCSDHPPPPESCCRGALERSPLGIPDLNFTAEEAAASGFDWSCGLAASRASGAQARKRRMEINRGKFQRLR